MEKALRGIRQIEILSGNSKLPLSVLSGFDRYVFHDLSIITKTTGLPQDAKYNFILMVRGQYLSG